MHTCRPTRSGGKIQIDHLAHSMFLSLLNPSSFSQSHLIPFLSLYITKTVYIYCCTKSFASPIINVLFSILELLFKFITTSMIMNRKELMNENERSKEGLIAMEKQRHAYFLSLMRSLPFKRFFFYWLRCKNIPRYGTIFLSYFWPSMVTNCNISYSAIRHICNYVVVLSKRAWRWDSSLPLPLFCIIFI